MPEKYQNKYRIPSSRLQGYDYGQNGAYFITICTKDKVHYFGQIISTPCSETQNIACSETQNIASLQPTRIGAIAITFWQKIPEHFAFVILDEFVVMPNHLHGSIIISKETHNVEAQNFVPLQQIGYANKFGPQSENISSVIRWYKAGVKSFGTTNKIDFVWQPRFYDHIIRDADEMKRIRTYIVNNPDNWFRDRNNKEDLYM
jgi:REP element-mobilizing transposase RayT